MGASEIGPRALGNRSILSAPAPASVKYRINEQVKHREPFRPFAPAVLLERAAEYFQLSTQSPFMLMVSDGHRAERTMPAVLHVDQSARIQTVTSDNGKFYELIVEFAARTGVPALLNTSFNIDGEPIVESPRDALVTFCSSTLDSLAIGDYLVRRV